MDEYPRVIVRNFGPFQEAEVEIRPLTIFIGKNSVGKSMLAQLLWTLTATPPDLNALGPVFLQHQKLMEDITRSTGGRQVEGFKELTGLIITTLPDMLSKGLATTLRDTFQEQLGGLIRAGAEEAQIGVYAKSSIEFRIRNGALTPIGHKPYLQFLDSLENVVKDQCRRRDGFEIRSFVDVAEAVACILASYIFEAFTATFFTTEEVSVFLVDSRAGIARALLKPYLPPSIELAYLDRHFKDTYFRLAEKLANGKVELGLAEDFIRELGFTPLSIPLGGAYTVYVKMWTDKVMPLPMAPSGIRESLALALALTAKGEPYLVFVEEPEAHLHPRAQDVLARVMARAVNRLRKKIIITTHSDYLLYAISDLIALHSRDPEKLGFSRDEALSPSDVALYLVKPDGDKAVVERLRVTEDGIDESEFAAVAEEIANRRARIMERDGV